MDMQLSLLDRLFAAGLLIDTGVDGLYGRSGVFEDVITRFEAVIDGLGGVDKPEAIRFPPGMNRAHFEGSGYMKSFPQLAGTIHSFCGCELDHVSLLTCMEEGKDWTGQQQATDIVLTPAACYPLYPTIAKRGALPAGGGLFDLQSYCFRHEPSKEPTRMQLFRMREYVRMGKPADVVAFRQDWMERGTKLMESVGLPVEIDVANDPFFGRAGKMYKNNQRNQNLKFELLIPVNANAGPTACMSFNYHQDHFGKTWGLTTDDGETAHTACVGFGLERIALALFKHHGLDVNEWPAHVRKTLWG
ncbi:amino acid--[acyl-carrier-protein] ligase [Rhizobium sp. 9140]|uniref:amino acid--[acyl-carrier-protein] ligase n=1 Tax=Rhizobium sp. 9140 TaxID=1761900 RepID=UPI00079553E4|nr:amino acid--[acyl-carrier-protein] ligase [Rhizobium sp. 9140]CZT33250.1 Seryl-tRNA synthetase [Rhizobium sp. 9140]